MEARGWLDASAISFPGEDTAVSLKWQLGRPQCSPECSGVK